MLYIEGHVPKKTHIEASSEGQRDEGSSPSAPASFPLHQASPFKTVGVKTPYPRRDVFIHREGEDDEG